MKQKEKIEYYKNKFTEANNLLWYYDHKIDQIKQTINDRIIFYNTYASQIDNDIERGIAKTVEEKFTELLVDISKLLKEK